ncbi:MAG: Cu(I)-responsive transcriptional regulator [Proteobacteria bacterium]|nr:Cu(I)-responsive transcriptional regulator [Pseudomonadota bacterium]MDA1058666.1 Cu(I)-responsive transcriptional regulator [Pseudomonadota bacterium]
MNIGEASAETGVTAKSIRYYESIDLIPPAERSESGYRQYSARDIQTLHFIKRSRGLGFSVAEVAELLSLYRDRKRASGEVKGIVETHLDEIDQKITELESIRTTLRNLADRCHGDDRPDCPILDDLAGALD